LKLGMCLEFGVGGSRYGVLDFRVQVLKGLGFIVLCGGFEGYMLQFGGKGVGVCLECGVGSALRSG
jgi:hypothetical protein